MRTASAMAIFGLGVLLRLPAFVRPLLSDDEAIYATTAAALSHGDLLYRDVVDHKPPLIYHLYQAGFALVGPYDMRAAHAFVVLAVLLTAGLLFAIARAQDHKGSAATGLAAAGLFLVFSTTWHDYDALAANCELFLLVPQAAAAWLLLRDLRGRSRGAGAAAVHLAVGALIGTSALFKYQGLTFLGGSIGLLIWWVACGRARWSWALWRALAHLSGAGLPFAWYLLGSVVAGNSDAALFWFGFNFSYLHAGLTGMAALARGLRRTVMIGGSALVPYLLGGSAAVATATRLRRAMRARWRGAAAAAKDHEPPSPSAVLCLLWLVTSAIAVASGGRFFGHYFHLILAPLCCLAAPQFCRIWDGGRFRRTVLLALCVLPAATFLALTTIGRPLAAIWDQREPPYGDVGATIAERTAPDESIFVWGNSPQLYFAARRPMGTRFSFCNYLTGESPGTATETGQKNADPNQLPEAWDMLFDDLERRRPALFVDAAAAGWDGYGKYPLSRYPRLQAYVDQHYRTLAVRAGVVLRRRAPEASADLSVRSPR